MDIKLPVSIGEALDKLTILDIKLDKISDDRRKDVKKEYDILHEILLDFINKYRFYYDILKNINLSIWEMQDDFRYNNSGNQSKLCIDIINENDRRYRIKKKINNLAQSNLIEQKGYKPKKAFVLTHLGLGDNITAIGMVRYLSTIYEETIVVCLNRNKTNLELIYSDDDSIKLYSVNHVKDISPNYGFPNDKFQKIVSGYDTFLTGHHKSKHIQIDIPFSFYKDVKIDHNIFWEYFHIPNFPESEQLYSLLTGIDYIFVHNTCSSGEVFSVNKIKSDTLIINPCNSCYADTHKYYELSKKFIGHPLPHYKECIINAKEIYLSDSSFMCMAINLPVKTDKCYYYSRDNRSYDNMYDKNSAYQKFNRKRFAKYKL